MKTKKPDYASMFTLRKDGLYMGYWHSSDGKRHAIYDRDPEELYLRIKDRETPERAKFSSVLDGWERKHRDEISAGTWSNYAPHVAAIKAEYGELSVDEITAFTVTQDLLTQKAKGYSYTVVNSRRCIWRMALDYAVADPDIRLPYNPAISVKNPKGLPKGKRSVPDDEVLSTILSEVDRNGVCFISFFFLCTGLRRSEGLHRLKSDVDLNSWEINIPKAKTKAGIRTVPIIQPLRKPLVAWMETHPGEYLFPHIDYGHGRHSRVGYLSNANWRTIWKNYCAEHDWLGDDGNPVFGAHNLRHGTATLLFESGVDVHTAQHILGHSSVTTTMEIYEELREKQKSKSVSKFARSISKQISKLL